MSISIPLDDFNFDFELPPGGLGAEIAELIDINALAEMSPPNALFTHSANISPSGGGIALFNATALQKGLTETVTFSLLDMDDYETEAALMMDILTAVTKLQTGGVAVVDLQYFLLTFPPFGSKLPSGPDSMVQWEEEDIADLLRTIHAAVREYFKNLE